MSVMTARIDRSIPFIAAASLAAPLLLSATALAEQSGATAARVPVIYPVPMRGQMGTDIHPSAYEAIVEDAKKVRPDLIVFMLESADINNIFYLRDDDRAETGLALLGEYRDLVSTLRYELAEFPQVMWVEDSVGFGSLMALSWPEMYMKPKARLWGLQNVSRMAGGWQDPDVAAKMMAAWTGIGNGFLQKGGYPIEIGLAMMRPENKLSATFEGRNVSWKLDTSGHWVVDSSEGDVTNFRAELAEDLGLCDGLADSLDDVAFLNGWREYELAESGQQIIEKYVEDWRRTYDRTKEWMQDAEQAMGWAGGQDAVRYLGQAKNLYEKVIGAMKQYPAVENRWQRDGVSLMQLEVLVEQLKEQIRGIRSGGRGGNVGGGGGGRGGGLGPGGPAGRP